MKSLLNRHKNRVLIPNPKILEKDFLIKDLAKRIASILKIKIKFVNDKNQLLKKNSKLNILLTKPFTHGQKINEELYSNDEKIFFDDHDKSIVITKLPNIDRTLKEYLKKILAEKNLNGIRKLIKKKYKKFPSNSNFKFISRTL